MLAALRWATLFLQGSSMKVSKSKTNCATHSPDCRIWASCFMMNPLGHFWIKVLFLTSLFDDWNLILRPYYQNSLIYVILQCFTFLCSLFQCFPDLWQWKQREWSITSDVYKIIVCFKLCWHTDPALSKWILLPEKRLDSSFVKKDLVIGKTKWTVQESIHVSRPADCWASGGRTLPAGGGKWSFPSQHCFLPTYLVVLWTASKRIALCCWLK